MLREDGDIKTAVVTTRPPERVMRAREVLWTQSWSMFYVALDVDVILTVLPSST